MRDDRVEVIGASGAPGAVKPELLELAVVLCQFFQLRQVELVVGGRIFVAGFVAIPRRLVHAETQPRGVRGGRSHAYQVALAAEPGACFYAVVSLPGGPEREAVVVLRDQHHVAYAGAGCCMHPLVSVYMGRVKDRRRCGTVAPLAIEKGVGSKVNDSAHLEILPSCLLRRRLDVDEILSARMHRVKQG